VILSQLVHSISDDSEMDGTVISFLECPAMNQTHLQGLLSKSRDLGLILMSEGRIEMMDSSSARSNPHEEKK
jgi:hypothetical protein